ncbi:MAG: RHS repeat domain-containing protein [Campylobacterota bacterium]|nr:RHS repeat domain-containing protein [Campylobacterota bacterium]
MVLDYFLSVVKTTNAIGHTVLYTYDAVGNITTYFYDSYGKLGKETRPDGKITTYSYDSDNLISAGSHGLRGNPY